VSGKQCFSDQGATIHGLMEPGIEAFTFFPVTGHCFTAYSSPPKRYVYPFN
jgi:hypothetical protein